MEKFKQTISAILDTLLGCERQADGTYSYEIYADYRDKMDAQTAIRILEAKEPIEVFWETLEEWYQDCRWALEDELEQEVRDRLAAGDGPYPDMVSSEVDGMLRDALLELVCFNLPASHYMKQAFYVDIMVDTGDGNYDYTLNAAYPCWYGVYGAPIDDRAGLVWLAKTQGCTRSKLQKALRQGDVAAPNGFLESVRSELANLPSAMSTVTFLVELTLEQLIELNRLIKLQGQDGYKGPYCGYIIVDKAAMTGLYDPWHGGGSVFEIQLERDVKLPIQYIRSALPDGGDGYAVEDVYGMCGSAWRQGGVKLIHAP